MALFAALAHEHPNEQRYPAAVAHNQVKLADNLGQAGRYAEAGQAIQLALTQQKALMAMDPNNAGELADILETLAMAVRIAYRQGDQPKAIHLGREGLSHFAATPAELQKMLMTRNSLSEVKTYLGLALMAAAEKPGTPPDRHTAGIREACALLADSVAFVEEVRAANPGIGDEGDVKERIEGLARCRTLMAKVGIR